MRKLFQYLVSFIIGSIGGGILVTAIMAILFLIGFIVSLFI